MLQYSAQHKAKILVLMLCLLSAPREEGFYYYIQTIEGLQYSVHKRRRVPPTAGPPSGHSSH